MTRRMVKFTKMHGAGNDYIYVNTLLYNIADPAAAAIVWSRRHTGIGSDGLVLIGAPGDTSADFSMRIFNADGSEALMCGNASRCVGKYLFEKGITDKTVLRLETRSGIKILNLHTDGTQVTAVTVDMLEPSFEVFSQCVCDGCCGKEDLLSAAGAELSGVFVSMGNPHFVVFMKGITDADVARYGAALERSEAFPDRCNIEFAEVADDGSLRVRVCARGSGITLACGTGACASLVAAVLTKRAGRSCRVVMDGGALDVCWSEADNHVYLTGGATTVFEGEICYDDDYGCKNCL